MATIKKIKKTSKVETPVEEKVNDEIIEEKEVLEENDRNDAIRRAIRKANASVKKFPGEKLPNDDIDDEDIIDEEEENPEEDDIEEEDIPNDIEEDEDTPKKKVIKKTSSKKTSKKVEEENPEEDDIEEDEDNDEDLIEEDSEEEKPKNNSIFNKNNKKTLSIGGQTNRINKDTIIEFYSKLSDEYLEKRKLDSLTKKENEKFYSFSKQCIEDVINDWKENLLKKYVTFDKVPEKERSILIPYIFNSNIKVSIISPRKYPNPQNIKDLGYYSNFSLKISFNKQIGKVQKIIKENKTQYILEDGTKVPKLKK